MLTHAADSPYLRVDAWDPGALAAAAVVDEALVDVVAIEAVAGPSDGAVTALIDWGKGFSFSSSNCRISLLLNFNRLCLPTT